MSIMQTFIRPLKKYVLVFLCVLITALPAFASRESEILKSWTKKDSYTEKAGTQTLEIEVTYYSAEYVEALVRSEAEKNLWTKDEEENYKYTLLKTLNLRDNIAFHISFNVMGTPMYPQPFDRHLTLFIGKKSYKPNDYDKRFNFKLSGKMDGIVTFARYDEKTGKDLLEKAKDIRLILSSSISIALSGRGDVKWVWDITRDNPEALGTGKAVDRLELDRLIKRLAKLSKDKADLQDKIDELDKEINEVNTRVSELQSR